MKKLALLALFLFSTAATAQSTLPGADSLNEGWNAIPTDGLCSSGTSYQFFVKPSLQSGALLLFFNGGGACWFGEACDLTSQPNVHSPFADMDQNNPGLAKGIFDFEAEENPFADFTVVYLPYCTGDVHIGGGVRDYSYTNDKDQEVTINTYHNGYANSSDVLSWVYENFTNPDKVVIAGSSAGAIGASFYSGLVAEHYPSTKAVLIADAAGGYGTPLLYRTHSAWNTQAILPDWIEYKGKTNQTLTFEDYYIASATHNDNLTIAQYNAAEDQTQIMFTLLIGDPPGSFSLPQRILNNYLRIESETAEFFSYTAGGAVHTILQDERFYDYSVEGVRLVDWVSDLIAGQPVADVSCVREAQGCSVAPKPHL